MVKKLHTCIFFTHTQPFHCPSRTAGKKILHAFFVPAPRCLCQNSHMLRDCAFFSHLHWRSFLRYYSPMTNIVITAINTRHTHSALGLSVIKGYWDKTPGRLPVQLVEFDLNQTNESIIADLIILQPQILAFSVYIWSVARTLAISGALKAAFPEIKIILGGPEVSFNSETVMALNPCIDFIVRGEGEITFTELLQALLDGTTFLAVSGLTHRTSGQIVVNPDREFISNLDEIPSPFRNGTNCVGKSFTYYEASRGCPSRCTYCLSSVLGPIRNHSIARVKEDLDWFFASDYRQIRFADRTFNFDRPRAREIISYIKQHNHHNINFHFEIQADFLSEDIIDLFADAPDGMFHLEIGVQSTNPEALKAVCRRFDLAVLRDRIKQLKERTKCHLHLDLLGGLPYDGLKEFYRSLDDVWSLSPHDIQISLVKVLRGTPLEKQLNEQTFFAMPLPPYTILRSQWLSSLEAIKIQDVGKIVEGVHNCQRFPETLKFLTKNCFSGSFAAFCDALADYWRQHRLQFYNFKPENIAKHLLDFILQVSSDNSLNGNCRSLIEHELRMTQKVQGGESFAGPEFEPLFKKHPWRVTQGVRAYWYEYDPLLVATDLQAAFQGPIPLVYKFERDLSATPSIEVLRLEPAQAFVLAAIQQRATLEAIEAAWKNDRPDQVLPDFVNAIEKLYDSGLVYKP